MLTVAMVLCRVAGVITLGKRLSHPGSVTIEQAIGVVVVVGEAVVVVIVVVLENGQEMLVIVTVAIDKVANVEASIEREEASSTAREEAKHVTVQAMAPRVVTSKTTITLPS